jgi:hypothetical protein
VQRKELKLTTWWEQGRRGVDEGLELYVRQTHPRIEAGFDELSERLRGRNPKYLDADDMRIVAAFKGRGAYLAVKDTTSPDKTAQGIAMAMAGDIEGAIRELCSIRGVAPPVASTILTAADPDQFGVIDRLTMSEVIRLLLCGSNDVASDPALGSLGCAAWQWARDPDGGWPAAYVSYVVGLRKRASELGVRTRDIEKALFASGRAHKRATCGDDE